MRAPSCLEFLITSLITTAFAFVPFHHNYHEISLRKYASVCRMSFDQDATASIYAKDAKRNASQNRKRICIAGGGFGGLYTALALSKMSWIRNERPDIVLMDKKDKFVFLPLLYDLAAGTADLGEVAPRFESLLSGSGITFLQGNISNFDLASNSIEVSGAKCENLSGLILNDDIDETRKILYDELVISLGAESVPELVDGAAEYSFPFYTLENCYKLKAVLRSLALGDKPEINIVVIGGSTCGVEIASTVSEKLRKNKKLNVTIVTRANRILDRSFALNRKSGVEKLRTLGINTMTSADVLKVSTDSVTVKNADGINQVLPADLVVWTAGSKPNSLLRKLNGAKLDASGKVKVTSELSVIGMDNVYCLGDAASLDKFDFEPTAQVAMQQSEYLAWNIWAKFENKQFLPFRYNELGQIVSLGQVDGTISALNESVNLKGLPAAAARRAIYALRMPTNMQRIEAVSSIAINGVEAIANRSFDIISKLVSKI